MPPVRKIDLMPEELREWLVRALEAAGYGSIVETTEELNRMLEAHGTEIRVGKSAVGEYAQLKKQQREAMDMAKDLLADTDVERESEVHAMLVQTLSANAAQLMKSVASGDPLGPQELSHMGRFMKDLMASSGIREKLKDGERERIRREAEEAAQAALAERLDAGVTTGDVSADAAEAARKVLGFVD